MNELSGPGSLKKVRGRRRSQGGVSRKLTAGSWGIEGHRSEGGAGPGPRGLGRALRGLGDYWRWVGPGRHFVERRGNTALPGTLTIFCFLRHHLSHRLSRRRRHHSRFLSRRRTVTSSPCAAYTDGATALPSLVCPLAPPPSYAAFAHRHWPDPAKPRAHWSSRLLLRGQVTLREQNPARDLQAVSGEIGNGWRPAPRSPLGFVVRNNGGPAALLTFATLFRMVVHGVLTAALEGWAAAVTLPSSSPGFQPLKVKMKSLSRVRLFATPGSSVHGIFQARILGCHFRPLGFSISKPPHTSRLTIFQLTE